MSIRKKMGSLNLLPTFELFTTDCKSKPIQEFPQLAAQRGKVQMITPQLPHLHLRTTEKKIMFTLIMTCPNYLQVHATGYAVVGNPVHPWATLLSQEEMYTWK